MYLCVVSDVLGDDRIEQELAFFGGGGHDACGRK